MLNLSNRGIGSWLVLFLLQVLVVQAKQVTYIYGDVADDGSLPSGSESAFH